MILLTKTIFKHILSRLTFLAIVLITSAILLSCGGNSKSANNEDPKASGSKASKKNAETAYMMVYKIDNQLKIFVNDELEYNSGIIDGNPEMNRLVPLSEYLKPGKNIVRIELYNGSGEEGVGYFDEYWEIYYELFYNQVPIDYIHERGNDATNGMAYSKTHEIFVEEE